MPAILDATPVERGPMKSRLRHPVPGEGPADRLLIVHISGWDFRSLRGFAGDHVDIAQFAKQCPGIAQDWVPKTGVFPYIYRSLGDGMQVSIKFPEPSDD